MSDPSATSVAKSQEYNSWSILSFIAGLYAALVYWWMFLYFSGSTGALQNYLWVILLTFIPIIGGINGLFVGHYWGGWKTIFGKGIMLLSIGLIGWSLGDIIWSFYNIVLKVEVPYPSIADAGFFSIVPFWFIGMIYIARAGGAGFRLRDRGGKILIIFIPIVVFIISYYLFLNGKAISGDSALATFFNVAYPLGDMLTASAAISAWLLMKKFLGGKMRLPIIILVCGFLFQYLADLSFSYASANGTYYNADWIDLFYLTSQFVVSCGVALLSPKRIA